MSDWDSISAPADDWDSISEPAAVKAGRGIREIPRQVGLTARYALEGGGQLVDLVAEPLRNLVINPALSAVGATPIASQRDGATRLADAIGLPSPQGANERTVAEAARLMVGAGGGAGLAARAPGAVAASLSANPAAQLVSAGGAGLAGGSVREARGGAGEQLLASIAGGIAAPASAAAINRAAQNASTAVRQVLAPKDLQAVLRVELERAGIDWNNLGAQVKASLVKDAKAALYKGEPLNIDAARRLVDYRNVGATPLIGDITQDPKQITLQRNLAKQMANTSRPLGGPDLSQIDNENAKAVISTLDNAASSPLDSYATGQGLAANVQAYDRQLKAAENALYSKARDSAGRAVELDRSQFVREAFDNLAQNNRGPWLPPQVREVLNNLSGGGGQFTVDTIDQLKTLLAQESRSTANGNVKAAIASVRDALENVKPAVRKQATGSELPITGAMGDKVAGRDALATGMSEEALAAFDKARAFARSRREWQESASFIEDALGGAEPDKFVQKHIINADVAELSKVRRFVENDSQLKDAIRKQLVDEIKRRGRVDGDTVKFSSAGMQDAFKAIGDRKWAMFFTPQEISQIKSAINVGRYMQSQPIGSAVNNSNTGAMIWGRISDVLLKGSKAPVLGPLVAAPLRSAAIDMQGRQLADVANALTPLAQRKPLPVSPLLLSAASIPASNQ